MISLLLSGIRAKKITLKAVTALFGIISVLFIYCGNKPAGSSEVSGVNPVFNETALFLAGKEIPEESSLFEYGKTREYKKYSKLIESGWNNLQYKNEKKIAIWREKHLPEEYTYAVFYPFSGPDIHNALLFFPNAYDYIMFGLESPGAIPQPHKLSSDKLYSGLKGMWEAVDTILGVNFFKTIEMKKEISTNEFDSVVSVMMFFLGRTNYEVLDVKKIWIDENGLITTTNPQKKSKMIVPGAEIAFRKAKGMPVKRAFYYQIDVSNWSLNSHKNFVSYIKGQGKFTTIIKSASYLMHRDKEFSQIRDLILFQSNYLLQDDSGIPLKQFSLADWKLSFYGNYIRPVKLFAQRYQEDLNQATLKYSPGPIDFSYGYNFREHKPNLMFAQRVK